MAILWMPDIGRLSEQSQRQQQSNKDKSNKLTKEKIITRS